MQSNLTNEDARAAPMLHEADIGSGERTPGQIETDRLVAEVPKLPENNAKGSDQAKGKTD